MFTSGLRTFILSLDKRSRGNQSPSGFNFYYTRLGEFVVSCLVLHKFDNANVTLTPLSVGDNSEQQFLHFVLPFFKCNEMTPY